MRGSQYTDAYLNENAKRGFLRGLTVGTFLGYNLSGRAKAYSGRYATALENDLHRREKSGEVVRERSINNGEAFYRLTIPQLVVSAFGGNPIESESEQED